MTEGGFLPDFSSAVLAELERLPNTDGQLTAPAQDLRNLPWASIDNDDSLDLDQLTVARVMADKTVQILVAIADVDSKVKVSSAIDGHAQTKHDLDLYSFKNLSPCFRRDSPLI